MAAQAQGRLRVLLAPTSAQLPPPGWAQLALVQKPFQKAFPTLAWAMPEPKLWLVLVLVLGLVLALPLGKGPSPIPAWVLGRKLQQV